MSALHKSTSGWAAVISKQCPHCGEMHKGFSAFDREAAEKNLANRIYQCGERRRHHGLAVADIPVVEVSRHDD